MKMYPDRTVNCDPLQHGDVVWSCEGISKNIVELMDN